MDPPILGNSYYLYVYMYMYMAVYTYINMYIYIGPITDHFKEARLRDR